MKETLVNRERPMLEWVDAHCHIDFEDFNEDRGTVVSAALGVNVKGIAVPGVSAQQWETRDRCLQSLVVTHSHIQWARQYGLHPYFLESFQESHLELLNQKLALFPEVAVGEVGLDYLLPAQTRARQMEVFTKQLKLANQYERPLVLHVRKAHADVLKLLKGMQWQYGGLVHAFSGSVDIAREYLALGFKLGVGGAMTYTKATRLRSTLKALPLEGMVLETDSPDMAPAFLITAPQSKNRAKVRNSPTSIVQIGAALAELKSLPLETVAQVTTSNSCALFGFKV